jgi:hypothetical protein
MDQLHYASAFAVFGRQVHMFFHEFHYFASIVLTISKTFIDRLLG